MASLRIRAAAVADLRSIFDYSIDTHGWAVAEAYMDELDRSIEQLREFPEIGEPRFELGARLRSFPSGMHRIYYRYDAGHVSVVRVLHKAQDARRWLT